jgi:hypothetical protein
MVIGISNNVFMESRDKSTQSAEFEPMTLRKWGRTRYEGGLCQGTGRPWVVPSIGNRNHFAQLLQQCGWSHSNKVFRGFPRSMSLTGTKIPFHASYTALPLVTSKFQPNVALPMLNQNFTPTQPFQLQHQNQFLSYAVKPLLNLSALLTTKSTS